MKTKTKQLLLDNNYDLKVNSLDYIAKMKAEESKKHPLYYFGILVAVLGMVCFAGYAYLLLTPSYGGLNKAYFLGPIIATIIGLLTMGISPNGNKINKAELGLIENLYSHDEVTESFNYATIHDCKKSIVHLGIAIQCGAYMPQNYEIAFKLFMLAYELGSAKGAYEVSRCYRNGYGVRADNQEEFEWLLKAEEMNSIDAIECLNQLRNPSKSRSRSISPSIGAAVGVTAYCASEVLEDNFDAFDVMSDIASDGMAASLDVMSDI